MASTYREDQNMKVTRDENGIEISWSPEEGAAVFTPEELADQSAPLETMFKLFENAGYEDDFELMPNRTGELVIMPLVYFKEKLEGVKAQIAAKAKLGIAPILTQRRYAAMLLNCSKETIKSLQKKGVLSDPIPVDEILTLTNSEFDDETGQVRAKKRPT
jgi:hypothetical protein